MPIPFDPYTDPDTVQAMYEQNDELLQAEIALLTGQTQRDAVSAALGIGQTGDGSNNNETIRPRFKVDPDIILIPE